MTQNENQQPTTDDHQAAKMPYNKPSVQVYGTLAEITRADGPAPTHPDGAGGPHRT